MAVTIRDVAKAAGVSPMAVSKVLHGRGGNVRVSEARAAHIRKIAEDLNYTPNQLARILRGEKKRNIGVIMDAVGPIATGSRYLGLLFDGIYTASFEKGYSVTVCPRLLLDHRKFIADGRFDGVIWGKYQLDDEIDRVATAAKVKIVFLHVPYYMAPADSRDYFCCDNEQGMDLAVKHLVGLGHIKIDFIVDADNAGCAEDTDRYDYFLKACDLHKIERGRRVEFGYNDSSIHDYLVSSSRATGVILRTENLAGALYREAFALGIRIPTDLSVIGFDSTEYCETISPRLTAIYQPIEQMARDATEILIKRIESREVPNRFHTYSCKLDIRNSTAPPPKL
jgi:DNA-binding LacI/PurR family transcriptional regulator